MNITRRTFLERATVTTAGTGAALFQNDWSTLALNIGRGSNVKNPRIIPFPQFQAWGRQTLNFERGNSPVSLYLAESASAKELLAAELIQSESAHLSGGKPIFVSSRLAPIDSTPTPGLYLVDWSQDTDYRKKVSGLLDEEDLGLLADAQKREQGYLIRVSPENRGIWLVGAAPQGVLYAAMTLVQLMERIQGGLSFKEVHIRDYPDFRYRAASDWLLDAEINRWAYDWGDGKKAFVRRIKRKLDFCLRYKINMVVFDGFGWNNEKVPAYAAMMRELNAHARARGIKLLFGGYGANYQSALVRPERNIGKIWYNQEEYPNGEKYFCFGEGNATYREESPTGGLLGSCRGNDQLNTLKAKEMEAFVRSVEPGALYIHHEDVGDLARIGDIAGESNRLSDWSKTRDRRCRAKWPNDDFLAKDGGAGAIAHGYRNLMEAIFSVKNSDTGYDASKDCTVIFLSPGYSPSSNNPQSWGNHLIFWSNVVSLLPKNDNVEIGFREVFPQEGTGKRWVDAYKERLGSLGLNTRVFIFFLGGADLYSQSSFNYPFSATATMNGLFRGAETIYNFSGATFQEPLQLLNSEFSWNVKSPGHQVPTTYRESTECWNALMTNQRIPVEVVGPDGLLEHACTKIYGKKAGMLMIRYYNFYKTQPRVEGMSLLVPVMPERLYSQPILWRVLELDRDFGKLAPDEKPPLFLSELKITPAEWQERWARLWLLYGEVNAAAIKIVDEILQIQDLEEETHEDTLYLRKCLQVAQRFSNALGSYHTVLRYIVARDESKLIGSIRSAEENLEALSTFLADKFSFDTACPLGGDQGSWLEAASFLRNQLREKLSEAQRV